ncbi:MAG TPA: DUF1456 family protein [Bdellovibrionota bacterium]|jgi:uncharacterized protein YehS (DUF1456 family)|nr:DUF1456 family protein [Bdellovibrionota bacterium]
MINNDVLRSLRHTLNVPESRLAEITALGGMTVSTDDMVSFVAREEEPHFVACPDEVMAHFLAGLTLVKRGAKADGSVAPIELPLTNNIILKKIRVAFELKDVDLANLIKKAGLTVSKTELSAFFRKPGHRNYRPCGDQFLRNLLKALNT